MAGLVLAYHEPGLPGGSRLVEELASALGAAAAPLEEAASHCSPGGLVVALLPARGGHLESLRSEAGARGCRVTGPLPPGILGHYAACMLSRASCGGGWIAYWRAKRLVEEQEEDMLEAARVASGILGRGVGLAPYEPGRPPRPPAPGACVVVASLLPGRLPGALRRLGWRVVGESLLSDPEAAREVASWVGSLASDGLEGHG